MQLVDRELNGSHTSLWSLKKLEHLFHHYSCCFHGRKSKKYHMWQSQEPSTG